MSGLYEAILADSRRDFSHSFRANHADGERCAHCGQRRWAHADDGFRYTLSPWPSEDQQFFCHRSNYRQHPGWTKPGTASSQREKR